MDNEIQPQGIPQEILKNKKAIDLYKWSLWIIGAIVGGIILIAGLLTLFGYPVSDGFWNVAVLLSGGLLAYGGRGNGDT